jgi:hypothetical protein
MDNLLTIAGLMAKLQADPCRRDGGFSADISETHEGMFERGPDAAAAALCAWVVRRQICQFARMAASAHRLVISAVTESEIARGDNAIAAQLHEARVRWLQRAFVGDADGLLVALVSRVLAVAEPGAALAAVALRFLRLLVGHEASCDEVVLERIYLARDNATGWMWEAPLNFFAAQGDGRWWHARRIPGGIAFSINSVGHLVASGKMAVAAAAHHARVTVARGGGMQLDGDGSAYVSPYDTDIALPSAFFDMRPKEPVRLSFTTEFGCHYRTLTSVPWSDAEERRCGCGVIVPLAEVPRPIRESWAD